MTVLVASSEVKASRWAEAFNALEPDVEVVFPDRLGDPAAIRFAIVWRPPAGLLASLPNLGAIQNLGAGVDGVLNDPNVPSDVPLCRLVDPWMTRAMTETALLHVMRFHRRLHIYEQQQASEKWIQLGPEETEERRVGILGAGELGGDTARCLVDLGFDVAVWSRSPKDIAGAKSFHGPEGLDAMLARSDILVCLLPLTPATRDILNRETLSRLPRGAAIVNLARGEHLVEEDLIPLLDSGHLGGAALDVFRTEPLPQGHPFWLHPKIRVTPHSAADSNVRTAINQIVENYRRLMRGDDLLNVVDRGQSY